MKNTFILLWLFFAFTVYKAQQSDSLRQMTSKVPNEQSALKFNLNNDGSHYFQTTFLNQVWLRYNESNEGTTVFSKPSPETFDIGLRRTRIQLFGQITDRTFLYFQFGLNNFNNTAGYNTASNGNRKVAAFFHDAICEYKVFKGNELKVGAGLTILNGLSRFSQPSIGTIMTLDVPVFLQYTVDQTDQFARRLSVYARGLIGKLDYRLFLSDPFPINSNGQPPPALSKNASFVNPAAFANGSGPGINKQFGGYFDYNFFETENNTTPYMVGTYLGTKKVWNIGVGMAYQKNATWNLTANDAGIFSDTSYNNMLHFGLESLLDIPISKEKGTALNAFIGYYITDYGHNYLRYNGLMNPATGSTANNLLQSGAYGNAFPMFGSGNVTYAQFGYLLSKTVLGENHGQLMPYLSAQYANFNALESQNMLIFDLGLNWLIKGHQSKISFDYQNRPTYFLDQFNSVKQGSRKNCFILQYQIFI
jgi:hypothetical protein